MLIQIKNTMQLHFFYLTLTATFFVNKFIKTLITNKHQKFIRNIKLMDCFFQTTAKTASLKKKCQTKNFYTRFIHFSHLRNFKRD